MVKIEEKIPEEYLRVVLEEFYNHYTNMFRLIKPIIGKPKFTLDAQKYNHYNKSNCYDLVMETVNDIRTKTTNKVVCLYDNNNILKSIAVIIINEDEIELKNLVYLDYPNKLEEFIYANEMIHFVETKFDGYRITWEVSKKPNTLFEILVNTGYDYKIEDDSLRVAKHVTLLLQKDLRIKEKEDEWTLSRKQTQE